jgi:small-conductance mechanosensitive channel
MNIIKKINWSKFWSKFNDYLTGFILVILIIGILSSIWQTGFWGMITAGLMALFILFALRDYRY